MGFLKDQPFIFNTQSQTRTSPLKVGDQEAGSQSLLTHSQIHIFKNSSLKTVILPISIIPSIPYMVACAKCDKIIIDGGEHYQKQTIRNRYHILSANGVLSLTVNVTSQKGEKIPTDQIGIDYEKHWIREHLRAIESAYRSAPFYEHYFPLVVELLESKYSSMKDMFLSGFPQWLRLSGVNCDWQYSSTFVETPADIDLRRPIKKPSDFPPSLSTPDYMQVFFDRFPFSPNLSIIDLLMNEGPAANTILLKSGE